MFLATVEDLCSRRMLSFAQSDRHPTAQLATDAINMAAAVRGGAVAGVIFHTDKGSQYTSDAFAAACAKLKITQSMGRVGCALDNAAAESFFSTLQHELISRRCRRTRDQARRDIAAWIDTWHKRKRLHSTNNMTSPIDYELAHATVELAIRDLKESAGLSRCPSGRFFANGARLACCVLAHNLARWTARLGRAHPTRQLTVAATIRNRLLTVPGRLVNHSGRHKLRLPLNWPWANTFTTALGHIRNLPQLI